MRFSTLRLIGPACLMGLVTMMAAGPSRAAEVLAKLIPAPDSVASSSPILFGQSIWHNNSDIRAYFEVEKPNASLPGFRTASSGNFAFIGGWLAQSGSPAADGFLTKVDAAGTVVWSKAMRDIMGSRDQVAFVDRVWKINDLEAAGDRLYICGEDGPVDAASRSLDHTSYTRGFVAALTLDGTLVDYTLFDVPVGSAAGNDFNGQARACSLSISTVSGARIVSVIGDAESNSPYDESKLKAYMYVNDRRVSGGGLSIPLTLYNGSNANSPARGNTAQRYGNRDIFVARFDSDLKSKWATSLGFMGDDYASSVASDDTGAIFLGVMTHPNADDHPAAAGGNPIGEFDDAYINNASTVFRYYWSDSNPGTVLPLPNTSTGFPYWDRWPDAVGMVWRMDTTTHQLTHHFVTTPGSGPGDEGCQGRIADLSYQGGTLYVAGEFKKHLRPRHDPRTDGSPQSNELFSLPALNNSSDIFVATLSPSNLKSDKWRFFRSTSDDFVTELTVAEDGVYLAGLSGGTMETFINYHTTFGVAQNLDPNNTAALKKISGESNSSVKHTFWQKLGTDLSDKWHVVPVEASGISIPPQYQLAGITPVGSNLIITGGWENGNLTLGPTASRKTLTGTGWNGFVGFLKSSDATWLEELAFTINSAYGRPTPHLGRGTVAAGTSITAAVPEEVYEDAAGGIIDSNDQAGISARAVVKRVCTGYQFSSNALNGPANSVSFTANVDTTLTFNWRTEYAMVIDSDLAGSNGLTSTAAGNPQPAVQKHWLRENTPFTAFIDGEESQATVSGVRWRSAGYEAYGSVATTAGIGSGFHPWGSFQARQQTPEVTVSAPGRIVWKWEKELSLRVATNSLVAKDSIITAGEVAPTPSATRVILGTDERQWDFRSPIELTSIRIRTKADFSTANVPRILLRRSGGSIVLTQSTAGYLPSSTYTITRPATGEFWGSWALHGADLANNSVNAGIESVELIGSVDRRIGSDEHWFPVGTSITASGPATVSSGTSVLQLKGYTNGTGSVSPFNVSGVLTKTLTLNEPSTITWDYARAIYQENVTIGQPITFNTVTGIDASNANKTKAPSGGTVSIAPGGSSWGDMQAWDEVAQKLYVLRPGKFTVEFENSAAPADATQNVIVEVTSTWPSAADYTHIMETPPVDLEPVESVDRQFLRVAYTEGNGVAVDSQFTASERGRSVLLFSVRAEGTATGNPTLETLNPRVVRSASWADVIGGTAPWEIGTAITSTSHNMAAVGHNGYVINDTAPVNAAIHARASRQGPIIPVNAFNPLPPVSIAWYHVRDDIRWPYVSANYQPVWPASPKRIVIASQLGSEGLKSAGGAIQPLFTAPLYSDMVVYSQADRSQMGFNPNEEHALLAPSFLDGTRTAAFALHNDLNVTTNGSTYTSEPYVLVQYVDKTDPGAPEPKMAVYAVIEEDAATLDTRLITDTGAAAYNQRYTFLYQGTAGQKLFPPHPLTTVIGPGEWPQETSAENVGNRIAYFEDKKRNAWIVSGDTDAAADIRAVFYYPMRAEWWHPTAAAGESVVYAKPSSDFPRNISYNTVWPADVAVLKAGETLTFSGGEYASDNNAATPRPKGLPQAVAWQSARVEFDESNPTMNTNFTGTRFYGRPVNVLTTREVPLALAALPEALKPASGNLTVEGLLWYFKKLPASLQNRIYYNSSSQKLGLRGVLNDRVIGDGDLLATPGAQTILQPNILTEADQATLVALSDDTTWTSAAAALGTLSRNPKSANVFGSLGVGMEPAEVGARYAQQNGPGIAVVTNPDLLDSGTAASLPDNGYLTIAENNDPALGDAPVAIHVIKIVREKYRGSVAVIEPENAFDEKVSLQHTGDFGGDVADLVFEWIYREEDGRDLNPPGVTQPTSGTPLAGDWNVFNAPNSGRGQNVIQLAGASSVLITDNVFFCRYRHANNPTGWSAWAGAANSREPNPASPSAATDAAYVAQLAPGWVKRVTNAVNVFDARIKDFRNNNAPATYSSMIQQAGQRWEGPVAFNPQKDSIEQVGIIELYQTVLDRAEDLSIVNAAATTGVGTALLNAANRIAGLYTLLGNEAMADALDPTVGYSTVGGQFGSLSPTIHAFQNQVGDLLQEELALLRGRGETGARPGYNRLVWNFTNGTGEAAYALNYGISDLTNDGFINDADARRLYPQGHGDAWGHYTMALKGYYDLAVHPNFSWVARSEKFLIDGVVLDVDYLDERTFAKTAAARAQCGTRMVDLTYRQAYTENPNGQWQGYRDVNTDRAWGVVETAQRAGTAAFCDWMLANAMLKEEETDPLKTGIRKVDRQTVGELRLIASEAEAVRTRLAAADAGMNPDGLDPNVVPFDIDPVLTDRTNPNAATHFEQIYNRAVGANQNALQAFNYASEASKLIRQTAASSEQLRQQTIDQDLSYRNQLIEIFGTPYEGQIGSGKAYPEGYNGPDLYLYMYVEKLTNEYNPEIPGNETLLPEFDGAIITTTITPNIRLLGNDTNPWIPTDGSTPVVSPAHGLLKETFNSYFPADFPLPPDQLWNGNNPDGIPLELPVQAKDYAFTAPKEWGKRQSPGEFQAAIQALVQAEWRVRELVDQYEGTRDDFHVRLRHFELVSGISAEQINLVASTNTGIRTLNQSAIASFKAYTGLEYTIEGINNVANAMVEGIPKMFGLANDGAAPLRGALLGASAGLTAALRIGSGVEQVSEYRSQIDIDKLERDLDAKLMTGDLKKELMEIAADMQQLANDEVDYRQAVVAGLEASRAASERVRTVLQKGIALTEQRMVFNQRVASQTSKQRYEDFTFRIMHHEALRKYQSSFDLASRYAYLAGKAYQYELNLPDNHAANAGPLLSGLLRNRTLGQWQGSTPVINQGGIAESMGVLKANYEVLKGQLGFNNPTSEVNSFSVRAELARVGLSSRVNADWRSKLETWRVPDLWNYQYQSNGVNYGYIYRRYCRPFAPEDAGAQPALVIPFDSTIAAGKNWFGKELAGGDSAFNASNFSTKIRSAGVRFDGFNNTALSQTPQVYLVPVGFDRMFLPDSATLQERSWNVVDQRIPVPLPITGSNLTDPDWRPYTGSASGFFEEIRKFSSFRAYHDAAGYSAQEMLGNGRLVGRSVWNTQWVLIIPSATLLNDPVNRSAGIDTLIYGAPLPGFTQTTAGTVNRDLVGIRDLRILLQTYSISGN